MNLKLFFAPLSSSSFPDQSFGQLLHHLSDPEFSISAMDLALVGLPDQNGHQGADAVREKVCGLKKGASQYKIADLGNLQAGESTEETAGRVREVCQFLLEQNVLPLLIGGSHELSLGQYFAYESQEKLVSVLNVDAFVDLENEGNASHTFLNQLLTHQPNYLFSYHHLAHQSYLVAPQALEVLEKLYFDSIRLGELRADLKEAEPLIRMADMMCFDMIAIRSSDAPASTDPQPFGLTGEEACQLSWYAGMNEKLSSIGFYGYAHESDDAHHKTAAVMAAMIWYFVEGFYNRKDNGKFESSSYTKYVVSMEGPQDTLTFFKSKKTDKWWMEVTYGEGHRERAFIPCSYLDYTRASHGDFPQRWIQAQAKLI